MHKRKRQNPDTLWDDVRDQQSAYRQAFVNQPTNGPDNDPHQGYSAPRTQQDVFVSDDKQTPRYGAELSPRVSPDINPAIVSAPVSRDSVGSYTPPRKKITLTPAQIEAARFSGLSIEEYGRQLLALEDAKKNDPGRYNWGQG
jgi:hypothetical protein